MKRILTAILAGVMLTAPMTAYAQTDNVQSERYQAKLKTLRDILYRCSIVTLIPPLNYYYNEDLLIKYTSVQDEINGTEPVSEERLDTLKEELLREIESFARIGDGYGKYKYGDIDHNGTVDVGDITYLQRAIVDDSLKDVRKVSDINGDKYTNINDVTEIQKYLAGIGSRNLDLIKQDVWYTYEGYEYKYRADKICFYPSEDRGLLMYGDFVVDVKDSDGNYIYKDLAMEHTKEADGKELYSVSFDNDKPYLMADKTYTLTFKSGVTGYSERVTPKAFDSSVDVYQSYDGFLLYK